MKFRSDMYCFHLLKINILLFLFSSISLKFFLEHCAKRQRNVPLYVWASLLLVLGGVKCASGEEYTPVLNTERNPVKKVQRCLAAAHVMCSGAKFPRIFLSD